MIDRSILYKSIIMRCDKVEESAFKEVPDRFHIKYYEKGNERQWAAIHQSIGEFPGKNTEEICGYFLENYGSNLRELEKRCVFLVENSTGIYAGTCMAWYEKKDSVDVPVLHWLAVSEDYGSHGYARVLITAVMRIFNQLDSEKGPIYLHTQPCSYKAVKLYHDFGFSMTQKDTYGKASNEYREAMDEMKKYIDESVYLELEKSSLL